MFPTAKGKLLMTLLSKQGYKDWRIRNISREREKKMDSIVDTVQKRSALGGKWRGRCMLNRLHSFHNRNKFLIAEP